MEIFHIKKSPNLQFYYPRGGGSQRINFRFPAFLLPSLQYGSLPPSSFYVNFLFNSLFILVFFPGVACENVLERSDHSLSRTISTATMSSNSSTDTDGPPETKRFRIDINTQVSLQQGNSFLNIQSISKTSFQFNFIYSYPVIFSICYMRKIRRNQMESDCKSGKC